MARIEADAVVATVKAQEIDRLAREAISGQAMLRRFSDTLAQGDLMLADELRFFTDMARLGKGEIIADLTTDFCRESRRAGR
jgi:L-aminopeptidase/D-esterase-like protein